MRSLRTSTGAVPSFDRPAVHDEPQAPSQVQAPEVFAPVRIDVAGAGGVPAKPGTPRHCEPRRLYRLRIFHGADAGSDRAAKEAAMSQARNRTQIDTGIYRDQWGIGATVKVGKLQ